MLKSKARRLCTLGISERVYLAERRAVVKKKKGKRIRLDVKVAWY
jgi:hypothetical protein